MLKLWTSTEEVLNKYWTSNEENGVNKDRQNYYSGCRVYGVWWCINNPLTTHEEQMNKLWISNEQLMNK